MLASRNTSALPVAAGRPGALSFDREKEEAVMNAGHRRPRGNGEPMNWKEFLADELEYTYAVSDSLIDKVEEKDLSWKPATGSNWMTTAQLLQHMTSACGACFKGFVTGDWGMPEGMDASDMSAEDMLPKAETMPAASSVAEAKKLLAEDKQVAFAMLEQVTEEDLENKPAPAPWDPSETKLGPRLNGMIGHLAAHKGQLFYYLKLQGKPVDTHTLWGA